MTSFADVITRGAMLLIDDVRWRNELVTSPAQFFRAKSLLIGLSFPLVSRPPELLRHLQEGLVQATYDDTEWVSTEESTERETELATGMTGYELCSVCRRSEDGTELIPYSEATYDSETGKVTFPVQEASGIAYSIDFYKDGAFADLTPTQFMLMSYAIAITWDERFSRNWLNLQPKIKDGAFQTVNEANYAEKISARLITNREAFNEQLRKYEQDNAYFDAIGETGKTLF